MPRKIQYKNPYCRRTKMSKSDFELLVLMYVTEGACCFITSKTRTDYVALFNECSEKTRTRKTYIEYYKKISDWIWDKLKNSPNYSEGRFVAAENGVYEAIRTVAERPEKIRYMSQAFSTADDIKDSFSPVYREQLYLLLMQRKKVMNGFNRATFRSEYLRAMIITTYMSDVGIEDPAVFLDVKAVQTFSDFVSRQLCSQMLDRPL